VVGLIFALFFMFLGILELGKSILNAFVLFTVSAIFLKGFLIKKTNYYFVAGILAFSFSVLMFLVFLATGEFSYGVFGIVSVLVLRVKQKY
jgi:hypothetical protein